MTQPTSHQAPLILVGALANLSGLFTWVLTGAWQWVAGGALVLLVLAAIGVVLDCNEDERG